MESLPRNPGIWENRIRQLEEIFEIFKILKNLISYFSKHRVDDEKIISEGGIQVSIEVPGS